MNPILISPHIDGETTGEQLRQMKSYLYQFKEQIEMILSNIDTDNLNKNFLDKVNEIEKSSTMKAGNDSSKITQLANEIKLEVERATAAEGVLRSTLSVQADEISAKVEKGVSYSGVTISSGGITCRGRNGSFIIDMDNIKLDASGNVQIKGKIEATSGKIGGWDIGSDYLYSTRNGHTSLMSRNEIVIADDSSYDSSWVSPDEIGTSGTVRFGALNYQGQELEEIAIESGGEYYYVFGYKQ